MADGNKTEKPTPRRLEKAREQGQVARSRDLATTLALLAGVFVIAAGLPAHIQQWRRLFFVLLDRAAKNDLRLGSPALLWCAELAINWLLLPMATVWTTTVAASFAQGGLLFAPAALGLKPERLNPVGKLKQIFSTTTLVAMFKSIIPTAVISYLGYGIFKRDWPHILACMSGSAQVISTEISHILLELFWKSGLVLLIWAVVDYITVRQKLEGELKMSREEIREEFKETEGNPHTKSRIRRLQRQARRGRMLKDVQKATVVITNPTHFAVALEYRLDMVAPVVVAKGRNLLAEQIKSTARWHNIPIMENPPLAQALYRTVEIGQEIPAKLYAAVAEILAFVFKMQARSAGASR